MEICYFCKRGRLFPCHSTREMTDAAIDGDEMCFENLAAVGWGESGEQYVRLNKAARAAERAKSPTEQGSI
jgi:hypothetical protein